MGTVAAAAAAAAERIPPRIDLTGVEVGMERWEEARERVAAALREYGCFEAVCGGGQVVPPELREEVLGPVMREVFDLPADVKARNVSTKPFHSYLGQIPFLSYESLAILDADLPAGVAAFADLLWPDAGNPNFCEKVCSFSKLLAELDKKVRRMLLESLRVEKYYDSHVSTTRFQLRISEYVRGGGGGGGEQEATAAASPKLGLVPHRDKNTLAIICQNQVDGLEIETPGGKWVPVSPSASSFVVIAGDHLRAWTNGRIYAPMHRVTAGGGTERYSAILFSIPDDELLIEAPPELVDGDHPALFRPYKYGEYVHFCVSERGMNVPGQELDAFCGVQGQPETVDV